jgi:acetyl-CoA carboxylase carboxyltransferase component
MFKAATEWALEERLPVVYLAANSGARVGLANEVKQCLQVCGCPAGAAPMRHTATGSWLAG